MHVFSNQSATKLGANPNKYAGLLQEVAMVCHLVVSGSLWYRLVAASW
ncbi:hypothetical protein [Aequorivita capsosiphonis]|nr:hypothetical protein [Aequorivita capsosiphonis]